MHDADAELPSLVVVLASRSTSNEHVSGKISHRCPAQIDNLLQKARWLSGSRA